MAGTVKTTPYAHQSSIFGSSRDDTAFGVWWEQGTGKSKLVIDTVFWLLQRGEINGLLVIAPNGVHGNFATQEMPAHAWHGSYTSYVWDSGSSGTKREQRIWEQIMKTPDSGRLHLLVMAYDAVARTDRGHAAATQFLETHRTMLVLDESTAIAEPTTQRSKKIFALQEKARYRRVLSGTPVADGPFKIYNQMRFLDLNFWKRHGLNNKFAFENRFAVFEKKTRTDGHQFRQLKFYRDLDALHRMIAPLSSRVLKEDVLDLPPKVYTTVEFDLTDRQRKVYDELRVTLRTQLDETTSVSAQSVLVAMTRLQQVTSGFVGTTVKPKPHVGMPIVWRGPVHMINGQIDEIAQEHYVISGKRVDYGTMLPMSDELWTQLITADDKGLFLLGEDEDIKYGLFDEPSANPRIRALDAVLEPITHKVIIWARYTRDVDDIMTLLGDRAVRYDGQTSTGERELALTLFRQSDTIQYFVANPMTLSMGVTLTQAKTVIYYSNTFMLEKRLQSEDRAHRIGQTVSVNVVDLVARATIDGKIVESLRKKFSLAAQVNGDRAREWI